MLLPRCADTGSMMKTLRISAAACAAILLMSAFSATVSVQAAAPGAIRSAHIQKMSAKRFKRGIRRTTKRIRHFIHRASGRH